MERQWRGHFRLKPEYEARLAGSLCQRFKALLQGASAGYFVLENLPLIGSLVYSNQEQLWRDIAIRLPYALCNIALLLHGGRLEAHYVTFPVVVFTR